jgi:hypothetical protein
MRIMAGVGDLVQRTRDGEARVGYSVAGRSRGRVTLCALCTSGYGFPSLGLKTGNYSLVIWTSKSL